MIEFALIILGVYTLLGVVASAWLLASGLTKLEPGLGASPRRVRVLLLPGCVGLWPLLALKVMRAPKRGSP